MAGMIALVVVCLLVFSSFFLAKETGHDCCGQDCPVCAQMEACSVAIRQLGSAAGAVFSVICATYFCFSLRTGDHTLFDLLLTLVSLKIRLND